MELLQGRLLAERLQASRKGLIPAMPAHEAAEVCDALLHGLEGCHTRGVLHLDFKPSVVWEVKQPAGVVVKILDFGLAKITNPSFLAPDAHELFEGSTASDNGASKTR